MTKQKMWYVNKQNTQTVYTKEHNVTHLCMVQTNQRVCQMSERKETRNVSTVSNRQKEEESKESQKQQKKTQNS